MNKTKTALVTQIVILSIIIAIFLCLSVSYYMQIHIDESYNNLHTKINQIDELLYDIRQENVSICEQLKKHKDRLDTYDDLFFNLTTNISNLEESIVGINDNISTLNDNYENLNYLYSKINTQSKTDNVQNNDDISNLYYGRLYIPDANISVALYYSWEQYITDRTDSASIFAWRDDNGYTIADHNNQEFSKLFNVNIGTRGYIELKNGGIIHIVCTEIFNGHNTGKYIVDENGVIATNRTDFTMYTCIDHWTNVRICLWEIV